MTRYLFSLLLCLSVLAGCARCPENLANSPRERATVEHVVVCWLKNPGDPSAIAALIETSQSFQRLPGVVSIDVGPVLISDQSDRPGVDSSFDLAVVMRFTDEGAYRAYLENPLHERAVVEKLKPLTRRVAVYDFRPQ